MDPASAVGSVFAAFGLAAAAGLNPWIPLLGAALAARFGWIEVDDAYDSLASTPALIALSLALVADFVGDKVPAIDHVLHAVGAVLQPAAGAVLFVTQSGVGGEFEPVLAAVLGALTAGGVHAGRAGVRPVSTAGTGGLGNPVLSLIEDIGSAGLTIVAFLAPLVALVVVVALLALVAVGGRRLLRRRAPG